MKGFATACVCTLLTAVGCSTAGDSMSGPVRALTNYRFDARTALAERAVSAPDFVVAYLNRMDEVTNYSSYTLTSDERALFASYCAMLPPLTRSVMEERLIAVYFISNFAGGGLSDFVFDAATNIHSFIVLNPALFTAGMGEWIAYREGGAFKPDGTNCLSVDCSGKQRALFFVLLHESTHVADYVRHITPYVEPVLLPFTGVRPSRFTNDVWADYRQPLPAYDIPGRTNFRAYGMGGAKLSASQMKPMYEALSKTPFVSLYASKIWVEDIADAVTFHHMKKLGIRTKFRIESNRTAIFTFSPDDAPLSEDRAAVIAAFYQDGR